MRRDLFKRSQAHLIFTFFLEHLAYLFFVDGFAGEVELELVLASAHAKYFKTVDFGDEFWCA
jgi:hypothetical protein